MCVTAALCITALFHPSLPHFYWRQTCGVVRGTGPSALQAKGRTQSKVRVGRGMPGVGERRDTRAWVAWCAVWASQGKPEQHPRKGSTTGLESTFKNGGLVWASAPPGDSVKAL